MNRKQLRALVGFAACIVVLIAFFEFVLPAAPIAVRHTFRLSVDLLAPAIWWASLVAFRQIRYRRLLVVAITATFADYVTLLMPDPVDRILSAIVLIVTMVGVIWPERVGLITRGTQASDASIRPIAVYLRGGEVDPLRASAMARDLERGRFPIASGDWAAAATLYRAALIGYATGDDEDGARAESYRIAGVGFWKAAIEEGTIRPRYRTDAWDEAQLLYCYYATFHGLIPSAALEPEPLVPLGGWDDAAEALITEIATIPLRVPTAREVRDDLAAVLTDELAFARGERSAEIRERRTFAATRLNEDFRRLHDPAAIALAGRRRPKPVAV
ncbi:MAG: hypothetical protein ACRDGI_04335 [Candidatus Limnocylindrales bacterium]